MCLSLDLLIVIHLTLGQRIVWLLAAFQFQKQFLALVTPNAFQWQHYEICTTSHTHFCCYIFAHIIACLKLCANRLLEDVVYFYGLPVFDKAMGELCIMSWVVIFVLKLNKKLLTLHTMYFNMYLIHLTLGQRIVRLLAAFQFQKQFLALVTLDAFQRQYYEICTTSPNHFCCYIFAHIIACWKLCANRLLEDVVYFKVYLTKQWVNCVLCPE